MTTTSITALYSRQMHKTAPEIGDAIRWYLYCYLPRQITYAGRAIDLYRDAQDAARIDGDTRAERDAEKARTIAEKTLEALKKEELDWTTNAGIYLL